MKNLFLLTYFMVNISMVLASSYVPEDDEVLYEIESGYTSENYQLMKMLIAKNIKAPLDYSVAHDLAMVYFEKAAKENNVRYYGRVQAVIKPWWNDKRNINAQLIKSKILQFNHEFDDAIKTLNHILKKQPTNFQARLMRASIYLVVGRLEESYQDCALIGLNGSPSVSAICIAAVLGLKVEDSELDGVLAQVANAVKKEKFNDERYRNWMTGILAELLMLRNRTAEALSLIDAVLTRDNPDTYLLSLKADIFLSSQRYHDAVKLLMPYEKITTLLVRLLIAEKKLGLVTFERHNKIMRIRLKEDAIRGQNLHLRERAYYTLYIKGEVNSAQTMAEENWQNQKETADLRLLFDASNNTDQLMLWKKNSGIGFNLANVSFYHE